MAVEWHVHVTFRFSLLGPTLDPLSLKASSVHVCPFAASLLPWESFRISERDHFSLVDGITRGN